MAVASPIYGSTKSKWEAMKWCLLSSLAEPAAALLVWVAFTAVSPTAAFLQILNALGKFELVTISHSALCHSLV